jgi:putative salt-induced outer membrane protein YdiY
MKYEFSRINFFWIVTLSLLYSLVFPSLLFAERTDKITLLNGDIITGEIKELVRGRVRYKTDDMSTIFIEWIKIARITSVHRFEVEVQSGQKFFGMLHEPSKNGELVVGYGKIVVTLSLLDVVRITPIKATFWDRLEGYVDIGYSVTRADNKIEWSMSADLNHRTRKFLTRLDFSSFFRSQDQSDDTNRHLVGLGINRFFGKKWLALGMSSWERNDELSLEHRAIVGGGFGRYAIQTNRTEFSIIVGSLFTNEKYVTDSEVTHSGEAFARFNYLFFKFQVPEMDIILQFALIPSFTSWGRVRTQSDVNIKIEIVKDFFLGFRGYHTYDTDPPAEDTVKDDYAITTTLGYKF